MLFVQELELLRRERLDAVAVRLCDHDVPDFDEFVSVDSGATVGTRYVDRVVPRVTLGGFKSGHSVLFISKRK